MTAQQRQRRPEGRPGGVADASPSGGVSGAAQGGIVSYIAALRKSESLGPQITAHTILPSREAAYAETTRPWSRAAREVLETLSIPALYSHQAKAVDALRAGENIVVATPTASGKSLIYALPVLERFLQDPDARSLFLFPLKALARDQLASFAAMTAHWPQAARPRAMVYDGDTPSGERRKIRERPPEVLFTNPEMLHLALLPHHHLWAGLFAGLSLVVVDEAHVYRGVLGSHMAQVFRRLLRIASLYGSSPSLVFCSATVGNPVELVRLLTGKEPVPILDSGAPQGRRHYIFMNPLTESPSTLAIKLLKSALARRLRTIVYCQSRRMTELISLWASEQSGPLARRVSAYRAGFLPEERRDIEARMASGELLAVISTSALELGIDIGSLDLCLLVGYPGTVMATLQRGGRVGRNSQESAVILIAQEDALDQYIVRHADDFFSRPPETAVLNPENPVILERHLECAAAELALRPSRFPDSSWLTPAALRCADRLEQQGLLLRSADGEELLAARKRPQRHISLRGSGRMVSIEDGQGRIIGFVDGVRSLREAHPGAMYLHLGRNFEVTELDLPAGRALARPCAPSWYTRPRGHKETDILSLDARAEVSGLALQRGRLRITDTVSGYEKRAVRNGQLLGIVSLDLPPLIFETEGLWFQVPRHIQERLERARLHFMGSIHALEHAAIGILPLLVMSDRNDFGGISTPMHPQTGRPTVFVYDGMPGGAGLTRAAFARARELLVHVLRVMADCPCELGCPSCVHSPKCGSGNRPIDKEGALFLLRALLEETPENREAAARIQSSPPGGLEGAEGKESPLPPPGGLAEGEWAPPTFSPPGGLAEGERKEIPAPAAGFPPPEVIPPGEPSGTRPASSRPGGKRTDFVVLDVETRFSAAEAGGWHRADRMGVSVAVLYDSRGDAFTAYTQDRIPDLARTLASAPLVVGFNVLRFDYAVLAPHAPGFAFRSLPTLDLLAEVREQLSYRLSLDTLARATLGAAKSADGLQALIWWKEQRLEAIEEYCRRDVILTRDLYLFGRDNGYLLFLNKAGKMARVRASWGGPPGPGEKKAPGQTVLAKV
ncbi:MAG: DEAD/DEAH box helicase [Desulfovibrio sp.]|jgi:DEAD/DEAH box helicase domain-containing protein|nr:DEAD/DEAH box helicase [Desulfovibrio sp.]